jgi:predicted nucleotidyltransferase
MQKIEVSRLRGNLLSVLNEVLVGDSIAITRHGRVIATLSGPSKEAHSVKFAFDRRGLRRLCRQHHIHRLALFGSVLRDDFGPDSDVDVLIDPEPGYLRTLAARVAAEDALSKLFGRPIDFVKRHVIEASSNEIRKRAILSTARVIYEAA